MQDVEYVIDGVDLKAAAAPLDVRWCLCDSVCTLSSFSSAFADALSESASSRNLSSRASSFSSSSGLR